MSRHASKRSVQDQVEFALTWLKRHRTKATLEGMARYAIPSDHAYGVAMKDIKALGTMLGRNQPLAVALWAPALGVGVIFNRAGKLPAPVDLTSSVEPPPATTR